MTKQIVEDSKLHPLFKKLIHDAGYDPAYQLITEISKEFNDIDGNLAQQFQTTGFNQRLWEILLFEFFKENNFAIKRENANPDFFIVKDGLEIAVEAVTSNPSDNDEETEKLVSKALNFKNPEEQKAASRFLIDQMTIKIGSALYSKLKKKYWEKDHIKGKPLILAIESFHHSHANYFPDYKIVSYLYGFVTSQELDKNGNPLYKNEFIKEYTHDGKTIPYGFFNLDESKNISAIIFTNTGNIDKFNRMGSQIGYSNKNVILFRAGTYYTPEKVAYFQYYVGSGEHIETWSEGFCIYHNPNAIIPLSKDLFRPNRQMWVTENGFSGYMPEFYPYTSLTGGLLIG